MGNRYLSDYYTTTKEPVAFREDIINAFRPLGGSIIKHTSGFSFMGGKFGIQFQSWVDLNANVVMRKIEPNKWEVQVYLNWSWGALMWLALVFGVILGGLPWICLIFYLFFDPTSAYQQALGRVHHLIGAHPGMGT